jgi:hypothetical protein
VLGFQANFGSCFPLQQVEPAEEFYAASRQAELARARDVALPTRPARLIVIAFG